MAFIFGLSLSNHWPLMVLVAPAFAVLLWPRRIEILKRLPLLALLAAFGLLPYAWLVVLSWTGAPISFYGPLESLFEIWYFVSRAGYAEVDVSPSASWLDRFKFFQFQAAQLLLQFAVLGTALAAAGFAVQWRLLGPRVSAFLTVAFLMPTAVLLTLLGFNYDAVTKHVFHVYPLTAYAVVSLWAGLGLAWAVGRFGLRPAHASAACVGVLALIFAVASRTNLRADYDWAARYAQAVISTLPKNTILFVKGDADLGSIAYFHIVENWRPDITLYQSKGLVLGNRLFHPLRTPEPETQRRVREFIEKQEATVAFTTEFLADSARRDRWLYVEVDKSSPDPGRIVVDIPEEAVRFFEDSVLHTRDPNAWIAIHQHELRRRYAGLLTQSLHRGQPPDERRKRHLDALSQDFYGALGLAEGLMANPQGYPAGVVYGFLQTARELMPSDASKGYQSKFFYLRGILRLEAGDRQAAIADLETAVSVWPMADNRALAPLETLYREAGDTAALQAVQDRIRRRRR
jgi:hypothetical protein